MEENRINQTAHRMWKCWHPENICSMVLSKSSKSIFSYIILDHIATSDTIFDFISGDIAFLRVCLFSSGLERTEYTRANDSPNYRPNQCTIQEAHWQHWLNGSAPVFVMSFVMHLRYRGLQRTRTRTHIAPRQHCVYLSVRTFWKIRLPCRLVVAIDGTLMVTVTYTQQQQQQPQSALLTSTAHTHAFTTHPHSPWNMNNLSAPVCGCDALLCASVTRRTGSM